MNEQSIIKLFICIHVVFQIDKKCAMNSVILYLVVFAYNYLLTDAIYANISENIIKNENDWTEIDGMWGPLLEEWTLGGNRSV